MVLMLLENGMYFNVNYIKYYNKILTYNNLILMKTYQPLISIINSLNVLKTKRPRNCIRMILSGYLLIKIITIFILLFSQLHFNNIINPRNKFKCSLVVLFYFYDPLYLPKPPSSNNDSQRDV